jgi:hypothetical protein
MLALVAGVAVSLSPAFGQQQSPAPASQGANSASQTGATVSPADAARKAREQKKQQPKPAHVWDDDNLPKGRGVNVVGQPETPAAASNANSPDAGAAAPAAAGQAPPPAAATPMSPKEQSQLQSAVQEAQDKISDLKKDVDIAQRKFSLDSDMYYGKPDYAADRDGKKALDNEQADLKDKQDQLQQAEKELAELQAKLGVAGGAPKP